MQFLIPTAAANRGGHPPVPAAVLGLPERPRPASSIKERWLSAGIRNESGFALLRRVPCPSRHFSAWLLPPCPLPGHRGNRDNTERQGPFLTSEIPAFPPRPRDLKPFSLQRAALQTIRPAVSRKKRTFPFTLGRAALCRRLAFRLP